MRVMAALVLALSGLATAHVGWAWLGPAGDEIRVGTQVAFLREALEGGAGPAMQQLFPEGDLFTHVLTGNAAARLAAGPAQRAGDPAIRAGHLALARQALAALDAPRNRDLFAGVNLPPSGVFWHGWRLHLLVDLALATAGSANGTASTEDPDRQAVADEAAVLRAALQSPAGGAAGDLLLQSYPGQAWPCDNVVALAALARAGDLLGTADRDLARRRLALLDRVRDPDTSLLAHRATPDGRVLDGPRASSQAIIMTFLPDLDGAVARRDWAAYTRVFVVRAGGLVGVREYPIGREGAGDVDSGPLVLGVSASASAVSLAAARRVGDLTLAETLDREAELLGLGFSWGGTRRYAAGQLPVGDAFLAWARTTPIGDLTDAGVSASPRPWWALLVAAAALPGLLALLALRGLRRGPGDGPGAPADSGVRGA